VAYLQGIIFTAAGRAGHDAELRYTPDATAVASFSLAVDQSYKDDNGQWVDKALWLRVSVFGPRAEKIAELVKKGMLLLVLSKNIRIDSWNDRNTKEARAALSLIADDIQILQWPKREGETGEGEAAGDEREADFQID